jgi:hypothetical protein
MQIPACNQLVMQVRTDGSAHCYYSVGTGLSTRQPAMPTRTVQKASTNSITRDDDGSHPPWPTSWTCLRIISELSKSTTTSPCLTLRIRWVLYEIRGYRTGEIVDWGSFQNFKDASCFQWRNIFLWCLIIYLKFVLLFLAYFLLDLSH